MSNSSTNNKRIARNTLFLYLRMFLVLIVSLYTSRVILNTLGVEDYGVYSVVGGFVSLFGFLNATLSASMQRFYNYELGVNGNDGVSKIYSTGLIIHAIIAILVLLLLETFGLWYVNNVMVIPEGRLFAANVLFQITIVSTLLLIMQIPYLGLIMAYEKMDYYAFVTILDVFLKLLIVLVLPFVHFDKLIVYSTLLIFISVVDFMLYYVYSKLQFRFVSTKSGIDKTQMKSMLAFSGWNLIGTFAFLLKGQGLNMLLNFFFGPIVNAARGIAFQVNSAVSGFSSNIATAFRPQLVSSYAEGNINRSIKLMFIESKISFLLIGVIVTPLAFEMEYVLKLWLGAIVPNHTSVFTILTVIDLLICTLNTPFTQIVYATGNLKNYQIGSSIVNMMLIPSVWIGLKYGQDPVFVFVLTIVFSIVNQIVCFYYANIEIEFGIMNYLKKVCIPCLLFLLLLPWPQYLIVRVMDESLIRLIIICLTSIITAIVLGYFVVLESSESKMLYNYLRKKNA